MAHCDTPESTRRKDTPPNGAAARSALLAALLLAIFLLLGVDGARTETPTVDEFAHLPSGCAVLRHGEFRLYPNNPPLARMWMAVPVLLGGAATPALPVLDGSGWEPWEYGLEFLRANRERYLRAFLWARLSILAVALAGGLLLYLWARRLYGHAAAAGALFLYTLCPNLQAHGRLATVDAAATTAIVATFVCLDHYRRRPGALGLGLVGGVLGLALLTKFTALLMLPVVFVLLVGISVAADTGRGGRVRRTCRALAEASLRFATLGAVALLVVHLGYGFRGTMQPVGSYRWQSAFGRSLADALPTSLPVPLPADFVTGLDAQKLVTERGEFGTYFAGRWSPTPPRIYTLALLALKLPVPTLLLLLWTAASLTRRRGPLLEEAFCWLPPLFVLVVFSLSNNLNAGIRYLLPILPFFYLAASRLVAGARLRSMRSALLVVCAAALVVTTARTHPHQLSYFNLLAGGPAHGHEWLIDSNLDWGQDLGAVRAYMEEHGLPFIYLLYFGHVEPEIYGIRYALPLPSPRPGTYVVSVNFAKGYDYLAPDHWRMVRVEGGAPAWLRAAIPADRIGYSLWVYHVP